MKELINIQSKLKAPKGQFNGFGKYKYRSCEDILEALKPLLAESKCTLTLSDEIVQIGARIYVKSTATLTSESMEKEVVTAFAREEETKKGMDGSQITGASSSYARKYALNGLFCIDDVADSDKTNTGQHTPETASLEEMGVDHVRYQGALRSVQNKQCTVQDIEKKFKLTHQARKELMEAQR